MYNDETMITIPLEEYKELLMIKGKYEELKSRPVLPEPVYPTRISYEPNMHYWSRDIKPFPVDEIGVSCDESDV